MVHSLCNVNCTMSRPQTMWTTWPPPDGSAQLHATLSHSGAFAKLMPLGGRQPVVLCQNSGFSVSINAIASLMRMNRIPCLFVVSWRGYQGVDAPEHLITGAIMLDQMKLVGVPHEVLEPERTGEQLATLTKTMKETREPVALVVRPGMIGS